MTARITVVTEYPLEKRIVLITGGARRIGRALSMACARAGADVIIHCHASAEAAKATRGEIEALGRRAWILEADFTDPASAERLARQAFEFGPVFGLVNNASIFGTQGLQSTTLDLWNSHMAVNLTTPFVLCQQFARLLSTGDQGRIVNLLDWRALRPGSDHFAYTISKAALAAMTHSLAQALAPHVAVNGLALGAILPPEGEQRSADLVRRIPAGRWGEPREVGQALVFLLAGPEYITGEIIHVDGGRHLT